jgi:excinuclease ABC subunit B
MKDAAKNLEFEKAALLRDQVVELRRTLALIDPDGLVESASARQTTAEADSASNGKRNGKRTAAKNKPPRTATTPKRAPARRR